MDDDRRPTPPTHQISEKLNYAYIESNRISRDLVCIVYTLHCKAVIYSVHIIYDVIISILYIHVYIYIHIYHIYIYIHCDS